MFRTITMGYALVLTTVLGAACPGRPVAPLPRRPPLRPRAVAGDTRFVPPEAYRQFLLAELARGRQDASAAERHLRQALAEDPSSPYLRLRIAEILLARGRVAEALRLTRAAQRVAPTYAESYFLLGRLLAVHRPRRARVVLERALRLDPDDARAYLWLARVRRRLGDAAGERAAYARLLRRRPDHEEGLFGLAQAWAHAGRPVRAMRLLERLLGVQPFAVRPRLVLARLRILQGHGPQAVRDLLDAMEASADDPVVAQELFRLYRVQGRRQDAEDLVKLMEVHASAGHLTFVATLYDALGKPARARQAVERALQQDPQHGPAVALRAHLLLRRRGPRAALALLRRVSRGDRAFVSARIAQAEILENEGQARAAIRLVRQTLRIKPRAAALQETLALLCARLGQGDAALGAARAAGRLRHRAPDDAAQRYLLALVSEESGRFADAARMARRLIADDPDDEQALNLLGYALAERGLNLPEAVRLLERARRLDPLSPFILDSLGWARHRQGRHAEAAALLRRATRADARLAEPWEHLGDALVALGRRRAALRAYRRALGRRPAVHRRAVIAGKIARLPP